MTSPLPFTGWQRTRGQYGFVKYTTTEIIGIVHFQIIYVIAVINFGLCYVWNKK